MHLLSSPSSSPSASGLSKPAHLVMTIGATFAGLVVFAMLFLIFFRRRKRSRGASMAPTRLVPRKKPLRWNLSSPSTAGLEEQSKLNAKVISREIDQKGSSSPAVSVLKHWRNHQLQEDRYLPLLDLEAGHSNGMEIGPMRKANTVKATARVDESIGRGLLQIQPAITSVSTPRTGQRHPFHVSPIPLGPAPTRPLTLLRPSPLRVDTRRGWINV